MKPEGGMRGGTKNLVYKHQSEHDNEGIDRFWPKLLSDQWEYPARPIAFNEGYIFGTGHKTEML